MGIRTVIQEEKERRRLEDEWWAKQHARGKPLLRLLPGGKQATGERKNADKSG